MTATNIPLFHTIEMPIVLDQARLDDSGGLEETLRRNKLYVQGWLQGYVIGGGGIKFDQLASVNVEV